MKVVPAPLTAIIHTLPDGLQQHLFRVRDVALGLAARFSVDTAKVELAALGHDLYRAMPPQEMLALARQWGLEVHPVEERVPILLHGPLAAERLRRECGVSDGEVLQAVWWHSTGCAGMGPVALVVFLADKLDPHKLEGVAHGRPLAALAQESLERAVVEYLSAEVTSLVERGSLLHPASVEARNDLLMRLNSGA
ncbi:MAG: bis(5'-nucleosyl)-tetraphosphatase (symmetrical) YqeK [Chloroflexi bacterium]|nr:bis(5'-nucleosyl)-tetraphosphatase (symmetrical) YqeK [Chloroflexota bacterium]